MKKLFCISFLLCSFFYKTSYCEEKKFNYDQHKEKLIEKKLLLNSFKSVGGITLYSINNFSESPNETSDRPPNVVISSILKLPSTGEPTEIKFLLKLTE